MKYLFTALINIFGFALVLAQTVTIANESAPVEYYRIPDEPLPASYSTYSVEVDARVGELYKTGQSESSLESEYLNISGYKKISSGGDIHVEAEIGDFNVYGERTGSRSTKVKNKDGNEVTKMQYYIELRYSIPIALRVTDKRGKELKDEYIYHYSDQETWRSSNYSSLSDLDRYWRSNRNFRINELHKNRIQQGMKLIADKIDNAYGYRLINENERFERIGRKRHPAFKDYNTAVETVKTAFKLMDANKNLDEVRKAVQPAIDFYKKADATCKASDKDGIKLKHIGLYNLALIYFWLEDFETSRKFAQSIYAFDDNDKDAKRLLEEIDNVQYALKRANRTTRHNVVIGKA